MRSLAYSCLTCLLLPFAAAFFATSSAPMPSLEVAAAPSIVKQVAASMDAAVADDPVITPAKAVVSGPDQSDPGDLIVLDAGESAAADYVWTMLPKGKTYLPVDGGKRVVFSSGKEGTYTFVLSVAKGDKVSVATHEVKIGHAPDPPPGPGPGPGPNPPPGPVNLPDGRFKLAKFVYDKAQSLPASAKAKAGALADVFESTAAALAAGGVQGVQAALTQLKDKNNEAAGEDRTAWKTQVFDPWSAECQRLNKDGSLKNVDDHVAAFNETAAGLKAVK